MDGREEWIHHMTWKVAKSGRKMPKKTTYFWPKIWSGFVLYRMK